MNILEELRELREEVAKRDPLGWGDYEWMTHEGDFTKGKINGLEIINRKEKDEKI